MAQSHIQLPPATAVLTADGTTDGYVTVASNAPFYPGALVFLADNTGPIGPERGCTVTDLQGSDMIGLRFNRAPGEGHMFGRSDCSAFLTGNDCYISQPVQVVRKVWQP